MQAIKKAIVTFRPPSVSPKSEKRELSPSPSRSDSPASPTRNLKSLDSDGGKPSRVSSLISHVRSRSLNSPTSTRVDHDGADDSNHAGGVQRNATLPHRRANPESPLAKARKRLSHPLPEARRETPEGPNEIRDPPSYTGGVDIDRKLSMTEMKAERRTERVAREDQEQERRRRQYEEARNNDPHRDNYGDLPLNQSQFPASRPLMGLSVSSLSKSGADARSPHERLTLLSSALGMRAVRRSGANTPNGGDVARKPQNGDARTGLSIMTDAHVESPSEGSIMEDSSSESGEKENGKTNGFAHPDKAVAPQIPNGTAARDYALPMGADKGSGAERKNTDALSTSEFESELDLELDNMDTVEMTRMKLTPLKDVEIMPTGTRVAFRARVHHIRALGAKIVFLILRSQLTTVQAVLTETPGRVSSSMVRWAEGLSRESIVRVVGVVQEPPKEEGHAMVRSASVHMREIKVEMLHVIAKPSVPLPFQVDDVGHPTPSPEGSMSDAEREEQASKTSRISRASQKVGDRTRLANRVLDLRTPAAQAIFRIHAAVCLLFRQALLTRGFVEIQSSKFQGSGTESGAAVFKVDYFRRPAFLAQSPQLAKQMCIAADMERVFEIGPVFRAENSNTHRHLTEFTGLDLEMAFESHYHEVLDVIDETLKIIFKGLQAGYRDEIEIVKQVFPSEELVILDETPRITFTEGIRMLREGGYKEEDGSEPKDDEDLTTNAERKLGALVKEKYGADYYILDKFPLSVRPFYTMPDAENPQYSNSYDIFLRGEEILSGGQRVHDAPMLEERMKACGVDPETMIDYVNGFRWGCPPHGGGGVGLERIVMLFLKLGDIRWASLFPRDPKSFGMHGQDPVEATMTAATSTILHGPESKTFQPGHPHGEMPPLENLIAKYGDATNTSWVDPAWTVWRDTATGAAVGYIPSGRFAVIFGNPLCEPPQIPRVVSAFLSFLRSDGIDLKPIWCCISQETERYLAEELGWSAIIAVAEERLNPIEVDPAANDKTVRRKIHRAEREGVKVHEIEGEPDQDTRKQIEDRCKDWAANRKGTQIHLTGVRPFDDVAHRKYFYATDKDGKMCALVVLAQLASVHGFQIKWALEFPGAPLGAIEYIVSHVIKKLGDAGVRSATFGAGAASRLQGVENVGGFRIRTLEKTYNGLSHTFHLTSKGDFRGKFGIEQDPLFICYPKGSLGVRGVEAIMSVLQKPK